MFKNLLNEMERHGITKLEIAQCLNVTEKTVKNYLNGTTSIQWLNCLKIKHTFFPNISIDYLFTTEQDAERAS